MLRIVPTALADLRRHAEETYPHECCGVLLGQFEGEGRRVLCTVRCKNACEDSPHNRYSIDPGDLVRIQREGRQRDLEIVGFYHSHPDHAAHWSQTDLAEAHWIGCTYVITSVEQGRASSTQAFFLSGNDEGDKQFVAEQIELAGRH